MWSALRCVCTACGVWCVCGCRSSANVERLRWMDGHNTGAQAGAAAALAGALGKLVNLTSLNLAGTWNVEWALLCVERMVGWWLKDC